MRRNVLKGFAAFMVLCSLFSMETYATQQKLDEVQKGIKNLEQEEKEAQQEVNSLSEKKGGLEGDLAEFNNRLSEATAELNETEQQLAITHKNLKTTRKELSKARKQEKRQYKAMKNRIRFLYEMDTETVIEVLLTAENFADFLNKTEYISSIHEYDRDMLERYRETKEEIASKEKKLAGQEESLVQLQKQQEEKQQEIADLVADTSEQLNAAKIQLADAQADVAAYKTKIEQQKAYEAELEAQKAAEDAKRLEEIKRQEEENRRQQELKRQQEAREQQARQQAKQQEANRQQQVGTDSGKKDTGESQDTGAKQDASDLTLLAALIQCEADGESYEGKLAVGSVVLNRVSSSHFPNTIAGVIYQGGQFSPVASGRFASVLAGGANSTCTRAAQEVLGGNITLSCLYFRRNDGSIPGTIIGNHVFY